jgi:hypothetical protein
MTPNPMSDDGWNGLDKLGRPAMARDGKQSRIVEIAGRVFGTSEGQELLGYLCAMTVDRSMLPASVVSQQPMTCAETVPYVAFREGQNSVVQQLALLVRQANQPKPGA